jgi:hypothetical protein
MRRFKGGNQFLGLRVQAAVKVFGKRFLRCCPGWATASLRWRRIITTDGRTGYAAAAAAHCGWLLAGWTGDDYCSG